MAHCNAANALYIYFGLFRPVYNPSPSKIVGRKLNSDLIARQYLDKMHAHFSGNMSQDAVSIFELNSKHCIWQSFNDFTFNLNWFLFCHNYLYQ